MAKSCCFFSKMNVVTATKKIFKIFFQLLKVKITCKSNAYRLNANANLEEKRHLKTTAYRNVSTS